MHLDDVYLKEDIEEKILKKHSVSRTEIECVLTADEPKHFKTNKGRYIGIGLWERFISVVYENVNGIAMIITAYPSSKWQVRLYKRK